MVFQVCLLFALLGYICFKSISDRNKFIKQLEEVNREYNTLQSQKSEISGKLQVIQEQFLRRDAEYRDLQERYQSLSQEKIEIETMRNEIMKHRDQMKLELSQLSQEIIDAKQRKFSEETKKEVGSLITDLQKEFVTFKNDIFSPETKSRNELSAHLQVLLQNIDKMHTDTEQLTHALRSNSKVQGDWGEVQLENLLEQAGLSEEHGDYIKQGKGLDLHIGNSIAKPDFLIKLPKNQWILIDSKVSLSAYERMVNSADPEERERQMDLHIHSLQKHIDEVAKYHEIQGDIDICPFLLMFLPIESAYASAITNGKRDITAYARQKNVIIIYPSTLFLTLRLIQAIWQVEKQNLNAQEIAERGGKLYDKFCGLLDELREVYKLFNRVHEEFNDKVIPKINGRGGLLSQCDDLQKLGAKNKKSIKNLLES